MFARWIKAAPIVAQVEANRTWDEQKLRFELAGMRMPERVRQNLLADAQNIFLPLGWKRPWLALHIEFRRQCCARCHLPKQILKCLAEVLFIERLRTKRPHGTSRLLQALAREIASPAEMLFCFLRQSFGSRIPGGFQLHDHPSESLRERVVNVAGHAITFCRDGRLAALL